MSDAGASAPQRLYVGSYTAVSGGHGTGITVLERSRVDGRWQAGQVVEADDPSFLVVTEGALHAVAETNEGRVLSYTIAAGRLVKAGVAASGGASPCHISHDPASNALLVANYVGGTFGVLSSEATDPARVTASVALPAGSGPVTDRQGGAHAHQIVATPWGTHLVSDLGTDRLIEIAVDTATLEPSIVAVHPMPAGSGPRHLAWLGDDLLVVGELDARLYVVRRQGDELVIPYSVAVVEGEANEQGDLPSHLAVHGSRVYVATRGRDTISMLEVSVDAEGTSDGGEPSRLRLVGQVPCGGGWPRHFAIADGLLYCANQGSDTVSVLPLDEVTGLPGAPVDLFRLGSPACIVAV
ncbi:beta-propeller fold lactonase family protein [Frigoribacterium sp. PhB24]|uniref:lactonase family protein n=1 Tax=Frigoribacterium sp. PhB24 TaxID=2485204 RepID=UPI000F484A80|nr:beta-propeller fold lactonase family protein [Frigoribacterium sp. PhB24]ROS47951.1 6-phosphogluconolactonase (cycloisomerase 2 family) [Frigoribacterium sp. PhB24]